MDSSFIFLFFPIRRKDNTYKHKYVGCLRESTKKAPI